MLQNQGPLSREASIARLTRRINELELAVVAESARWGRTGPPYKKSHWDSAVEELQVIIRSRSGPVIGQLIRAKRYKQGMPNDEIIAAPLYPEMGTPEMDPASGYFPLDSSVTVLSRIGDVFVTVDGSDPKMPDGSVSPKATKIEEGSTATFTLSESYTKLSARRRVGEDWSFLATEHYKCDVVPANMNNVTISEFMYHPSDPSSAETEAGFDRSGEFEFVEILNTSESSVDLARSAFVLGIQFEFAHGPGSILSPGERTVLARNRDAFRLRYTNDTNVAGQFKGKISDDGEMIQFVDASGIDLCRFAYSDRGKWSKKAGGAGHSLVQASSTSNQNLSNPNTWKLSKLEGGSPGRPETSD